MNYRIFAVVSVLLFSFAFAKADKTTATSNSEITSVVASTKPVSFKEKVANLYGEFSTKNATLPALSVFEKAMEGYEKLENQGKVNKEILTVVDFDLSSKKKRMWIMDMKNKEVLFNTYVSHGQKTGVEFAKQFSNKVNSHKSSLGFFVTGETYIGKNGLSLFLDGMEKGINNNARKRYVVIHGADYATGNFVSRHGRLGRSYGCPAVPKAIAKSLINKIKGESVVYINKNDPGYMSRSSYLN
ncbi:MAG: murein L,D-transpeptidase catalytic domain family protein [Salegentibacter sp.]